MEPKLETDDLARAVDGERIVDGVDLRVREGEVVAVIGSSGAGKSSFFRLLDRLDEPTGGTVHLDGERPSAGTRRPRDRSRDS